MKKKNYLKPDVRCSAMNNETVICSSNELKATVTSGSINSGSVGAKNFRIWEDE